MVVRRRRLRRVGGAIDIVTQDADLPPYFRYSGPLFATVSMWQQTKVAAIQAQTLLTKAAR